MPLRASKLLPSIGHAASGAGGTVVSTLVTYPLDLVNTRLKVQRQLRADGTISEEDAYRGLLDAFGTIYTQEGGLSAFFVGLGSDLAKSAADSFLFFLFYTWFRARRLRARNDARYLSPFEELAVGAVAGMCAKLFTTPVSNVVTRKQTASLLLKKDKDNHNSSRSPSPPQDNPTTSSQIVSSIRREKGVLGLWAGYSASIVLTMNPSLTFFLQQFLKRLLVPRRDWDEPGARTIFLLAAMSKSVATTVTYPFQIAKARVQVSSRSPSPSSPSTSRNSTELDRENTKDGATDNNYDGTARQGRKLAESNVISRLASDTIFATVFRIAQVEGIKALYDGIGGELLKAFFNHGTTMLFKDIIHGLLVKGYFAVIILIRGWPLMRAQLRQWIRRKGYQTKLLALIGKSQMEAVYKRGRQAMLAAGAGGLSW